MSTAPLLSLPRGRHLHELEAQLGSLGAHDRPRLVVCCDEPESTAMPLWRAIGPSIFLRSPGASHEDPGLREALHAAVTQHGVRDVNVVLHSRCFHLDPAFRPGREPEVGGRDETLSFMDRLYARRECAERQLAAARERVRTAIRTWADEPTFEGVNLVGLVQVVESGVLHAYDPERDDFEAWL